MVSPAKSLSRCSDSDLLGLGKKHESQSLHARQTVYTVSYNSESHFQVLTQMWGSKWPQVLPFCLFNVALMLLLTFIDVHFEAESRIEMTTQGHAYISVVVAFLLISRVNMGLARYNAARSHLGVMYREARQLVQYAFVYSANSADEASREWRAEVAYRTMILLRTAMAVIDYTTTGVPAWDVPELRGAEREDVKRTTYLDPGCRRWAHGDRSEGEESMRVPVRISYLLKKTIHSQGTRLANPIIPALENKIMSNVDGFLSGYYGMRQFLTTPVPFPFVQMSRTFLFVYVFTIPFSLLGDKSSLFAHCFVVFLLTYGFVGLEIVAIELDNPFGEDDNDFDNAALAATAYEDTYMTILDVDGAEWVDRLRHKMHDPTSSGYDLPNEQSWLMSSELA